MGRPKKPAAAKLLQLQARIPPAVLEVLDARAAEAGRSRSDAIRAALRRYPEAPPDESRDAMGVQIAVGLPQAEARALRAAGDPGTRIRAACAEFVRRRAKV